VCLSHFWGGWERCESSPFPWRNRNHLPFFLYYIANRNTELHQVHQTNPQNPKRYLPAEMSTSKILLFNSTTISLTTHSIPAIHTADPSKHLRSRFPNNHIWSVPIPLFARNIELYISDDGLPGEHMAAVVWLPRKAMFLRLFGGYDRLYVVGGLDDV